MYQTLIVDPINHIIITPTKNINLKTLTCISESSDHVHRLKSKYMMYESQLIESFADEAMLTKGIKILLDYGTQFASWSLPKLWDFLKEYLPKDVEDWIHFSVDTLSLLLDLLGPFTGGAGTAASAVIDVIHGVTYLVLSQTTHKEKEYEYLFLGLVTIGFAVYPGIGNTATLGLKAFIKKNPIGNMAFSAWITKLNGSWLMKPIKSIFKFFANNVPKFVGLFSKLFDKLLGITLVKSIFKYLGITKTARIVMDNMQKYVSKLLKLLGVDDKFILNQTRVVTKKVGKNKTKTYLQSELYVAFKKKMKMMGLHAFGAHTHIKSEIHDGKLRNSWNNFSNLYNILTLLFKEGTTFSDLGLSDTDVSTKNEFDFIQKKFNEFISKHGKMIFNDDSKLDEIRNSDTIDSDVIKKVQNYLNNISLLADESPIAVNGKLDFDTVNMIGIFYTNMSQLNPDDYVDDKYKEKAKVARKKGEDAITDWMVINAMLIKRWEKIIEEGGI